MPILQFDLLSFASTTVRSIPSLSAIHSLKRKSKAWNGISEDHLRQPFPKQVKARDAAANIKTYEERLFQQVFADMDVYAQYKQAVQASIEQLRFEISGSPEFHSWHWEALKDSKLPRAFALEAPMVRKNLQPVPLAAQPKPSPILHLLIITARPHGQRDVGYRIISRQLIDALNQAHLPIDIEILRPGTYQALADHLQQVRDQHGTGYYHVIHLDVHGAVLSHAEFQAGCASDQFLYQTQYGRPDIAYYDGERVFLFLEGKQDGQADPVEAGELAEFLITHQVPIVILNACQSGKQVGAQETSLGSRLMQAGVQLVLAMGHSITVSAVARMNRRGIRDHFPRIPLRFIQATYAGYDRASDWASTRGQAPWQAEGGEDKGRGPGCQVQIELLN
jgi:hypothetical protein